MARRSDVLVIDDHVDTAEMVAHFLEWRGIDCAVAFDDSFGRLSFEACRPRVVVMDLSLPTFDGAIRLANDFATAPDAATVVAMNGYGFTRFADAALASGCSIVLPKPFRLEDLHRAVLIALRRNPDA